MAATGDPLADMQNVMGYAGLVGQNPYMNSLGQNAIPFTTRPRTSGNYYTGDAGDQPPTDVYGNPIQSFVDANATKQAKYQSDLAAYNAGGGQQTQGTTLNSLPQQQFADLQEQVNQGTINAANASYGSGPGYSGRGAETGIANYPGAVDAIIADSNYRTQANQQYAANPDFGLGMPAQSQPAQSQSQTKPTPPDTTQDYLNALANPTIRSYGANQPQAGQSLTGSVTQPNVLQGMLASGQDRSGILAPLKAKAATA